MNSPETISIIAAIQEKDRGLGYNNQLLFKISEDLKRFKKITSGHPIIMGRKTFESIGFPLPNRLNIIITRNNSFDGKGAILANSLQKAIILGQEQKTGEIFIIGGGEIYSQALAFADRLYITLVEGVTIADTFFPEYKNIFTTVEESELFTDPSGTKYKFSILEK